MVSQTRPASGICRRRIGLEPPDADLPMDPSSKPVLRFQVENRPQFPQQNVLDRILIARRTPLKSPRQPRRPPPEIWFSMNAAGFDTFHEYGTPSLTRSLPESEARFSRVAPPRVPRKLEGDLLVSGLQLQIMQIQLLLFGPSILGGRWFLAARPPPGGHSRAPTAVHDRRARNEVRYPGQG